MRKTTCSLLLWLCTYAATAQDITGQWNGLLKVNGTQLRIVFHITTAGSGFTSTMDSPDQGAKGIPVTTTVFNEGRLTLAIAQAGIEYNGVLKDNAIIGVFKQGGLQLPMDLSRDSIAKKPLVRPQEPVKPYPYYSEEVKFENKHANVTLAGTLTLPAKDGVYPVVILITGSGPQNRDEELLGHKPFLVIADYLTRNGMAVLRYDDRGTVQSTGDFKSATTADFANDVQAAIAYLKTRKEINIKKIGLAGHSEGGVVAPLVASTNRDINFIVLLAGTGIPGDQLFLSQEEMIARAAGVADSVIQKTKKVNSGVFDLVIHAHNTDTLKAAITTYLQQVLNNPALAPDLKGQPGEAYVKEIVNEVTTPWMQYFIKYDPAPALEKVHCAVLAVGGDKDVQVPAAINLAAISAALKKGGNTHVTTIVFPGLNHLFQECTTGSPAEYAGIEQTFSPVALTAVTTWIQAQVSK